MIDIEKKIAELEAERDALKVHVHRLRDELENSISINEENIDNIRDAKVLLKETPEESLIHLKTKWQAEALDKFASEFGTNNESQDAVISDCFERAAELRRQAEEKDHD